MPNQHEYRRAAYQFASQASVFPNNCHALTSELSSTGVEGPIREYFDDTMGEATGAGQRFENDLIKTAGECFQRAEVCAQYTLLKRLHRLDPEIYGDPDRPAPWVVEG